MARGDSVEGSSSAPLSPQDRKMYEQEYRHGADLFGRALEQYKSNPDNMYKQEEFKQVMDKAMLVLNETSRELKKQSILTQTQKIEQDYETFQSSESEETAKQLAQDLAKAKGLIR